MSDSAKKYPDTTKLFAAIETRKRKVAELALKNWDDSVHFITESEFEAVYKSKLTPQRD